MKIMKPQHAMLQVAPTQFGAVPGLGISVGYGFRLSDPRVLLHEAGIWRAFMSTPLSTRIMETALPKQNAEWLLGGHASCIVDVEEIGKQITGWQSSVSLADVRKTVHCSAQAQGWSDPESGKTQGLATLAVDYPNATRDRRGRLNPVGANGVAPLQLMGRVGPVGSPLAAMGPVDAQWQSRADLAPIRSAVLDPLGRDGTHMGWPDPMDFRYFQLAPEDQRSHAQEWAIGSAFELLNMGREGRAHRGALPDLRPQLAVRRRTGQALEPVLLRQQTVWFLPDHDTGVVWWNGLVETECVLSNEIDLIITALRESERPLSAQRVSDLVVLRSTMDLENISALRDSDLLPERSRGWTWELILGAEDHPSSIEWQPHDYQTLQTRIDAFEENLDDAQRGGEKMRSLKSQADEAPWDAIESLRTSLSSAAVDWRSKLADADKGTVLSDLWIDGADLSALHMDGVRFEQGRLQRAKLRQTIWRHCQFQDVQFSKSDLSQSHWENCSFVRCRFAHDALADTQFSACEWQMCTFDACTLDGSRFTDGEWEQMTLQSLEGARLSVQRLSWNNVSWIDCQLKDARWNHVEAMNSSVVQCSMPAIRFEHCTLEKFSVVKTDLTDSQWLQCSGTAVNLAEVTKLDGAVMSDCRLEKTAWLGVSAHRIKVQNCALLPLNAQGLAAPHSRWSHCVLSEANMMHADLSCSTIEATSLKDANLYGADFRMSKVTHSNLIRLQAGWVHAPEAFAGPGNLTARSQFIPRRQL